MSGQDLPKQRKPKIDLSLAIPTVIVFLVIAFCLTFAPDRSSEVINILLGFLTNQFGWLFELAGLFMLAFCLWLSFSRYGRIKLGAREDKPQFSTITWIAMLFCTGIGTTLFYWAIVEPLFYLSGPPEGVIPGTTAAREFALTYGIFHWGVTAWAFYIIPTIPIAYAVYVKGFKVFRFSIACKGVLGKYSDGILGKIIDILVLFGIFGAIMASLGTGVPLLAEMIHTLFGWANGTAMKIGILIIWLLLFGTSVYLGLEKGIARLSKINIFISYGLLAIVFLVGPTIFIFNLSVDSLGLMLDNFLRMSLWTDAIAQGGFPQTWTTFYFAWWLAFGPVMGLFVAKISRGRTIKQVVMGELIFGTLGCWLYFFVFGGYGLSLEFSGNVALVEIANNLSGNAAVVALLESLPWASVILFLAIINAFIFSGTSYDSAAYTLAFSTLKVTEGEEIAEPARWWRLFWAILLAVGSLALMAVGGLSSLQIACVVVGLPLIPVFVIMIISFLRWAKKDFGYAAKKDILILEKSKMETISQEESNV